MRRSLILAGGGLKVAFQAGVLQVWLDEAGVKFNHADGASGGVFNLAMYCQGMTGREIADNWRKLDPTKGIAPNWKMLFKLFYADSLLTMDRFRKNVFTGWGLDWDRIRSSEKEATFNVYNFTKHELAIIEPAEMSEDMLVAAVSLPMWFPPVTVDGETYIDAVYATDANIEEAVRRGADELWVIWTVSDKNRWRNGFIANYFQIIEAASNSNLKRVLRRIEENNKAIREKGGGEFGRPIKVRLLKAEVPLHYLINFSREHIAETVNLGVLMARKWCTENNIELDPGKQIELERPAQARPVSFTEEMKGYVSFLDCGYEEGYRKGRQEKNRLMFHLTIAVDNVDSFVTEPLHEVPAMGYVECAAMGGRMPVTKGTFNLFVDEQTPASKRMLYRLFFNDAEGNLYTLSGYKEVKDDPGFDAWKDTTTLFVHILKGHVRAGDDLGSEIAATGIIRIGILDFARQLTTFRSKGSGLSGAAFTILYFGKFFLRNLWDIYVKQKIL